MSYEKLQNDIFDACDNIETAAMNFDPDEGIEEEDFIQEAKRLVENIEEFVLQIKEAIEKHNAAEKARHLERLKEMEKELEGCPELAYSLIVTGEKDGKEVGDAIIVKKGESGYYPTDWPKGVYTHEMIDEMNRGLGLTEEQAELLVTQSFWKRK